jgi:hypothetical protein
MVVVWVWVDVAGSLSAALSISLVEVVSNGVVIEFDWRVVKADDDSFDEVNIGDVNLVVGIVVVILLVGVTVTVFVVLVSGKTIENCNNRDTKNFITKTFIIFWTCKANHQEMATWAPLKTLWSFNNRIDNKVNNNSNFDGDNDRNSDRKR